MIRGGLTREPIVEEDLNMVSPLHCLLRILEFALKLLYHLRSSTFMWTESPKELGLLYDSYIKAKADVCELVYEHARIKVDIPDPTGKGGTTTIGNICERLFKDYGYILVMLAPDCFKSDYAELLNRLWLIISLYASKSKKHINTVFFKEFCSETYDHLLNNFNNNESKWINISPTLHMTLAHAWEIIDMNNTYGLGDYSESGLEHNHKFLRFFRSCLARKYSQEANLKDCINRFWLKSDPGVRNNRNKKQCSKCGVENDHFTVSCPQKRYNLNNFALNYSTCLTLYDYHCSLLYS